MPATYKKIASVTATTSQASLEFTSIPGTYTDLMIKLSLRTTGGTQNCSIAFNGSTSNFSQRQLGGDGSSAYSASRTDNLNVVLANGTGYTADVWASNELYIPNYTSSTNKSFSTESATENNATGSDLVMRAHLWSPTTAAAITSITFYAGNGSGNFATNSTATLYGILKA
jgi:hypothetical protein